jgi:hypothetical protein
MSAQPVFTEKILQAFDDVLILTTRHVRFRDKIASQTDLVSTPLDQVTSCRIAHRSRPIWFILAAVMLIGGGIVSGINLDPSFLEASAVIAVLMVLIYFGTRRGVLIIHATRDAITVPFIRSSLAEIEKFIDTLEDVRRPRIYVRE